MAFAQTDAPYIVCVGDLHAGSVFAPCPPRIRAAYDIEIHASRVQQWLHACWLDFTEKFVPSVVGRNKYELELNGDLIEGLHHGGQQLISDKTRIHRQIAIDLLEPLAAKARRIYAVKGTECHTRDDEEEIGKILKAVPCPSTDNHAPDWWDIRVRGCLTSFRHHIPATSRRALKGSQLSIQLIEEQAEAAGAGSPIPRVVVRSHRHTYGSYDDGCGMAVVLPAWQLLTRHAHKVVPAAQRGIMVGGVVLDYSRVRGPADLPTVHRKLYRPTEKHGADPKP